MNELNAVQEHYTVENLPGKIESALQGAGFGEGPIEWSKLAGADQFHARGLEATKELAEALGLAGGESFLDIGCGFGGPARFLAGQYGCHVTGIDLTPVYIEVAEMLARRTGLADRLTFIQGDALELPFSSDSFDAAWIMHVGMNIANKEQLYSGVHQVLRPGGRLAVYDVVAGNGEPVLYPLPWARDAVTSFLVTQEGLTRALQAAGFREVSSTDQTPATLQWVAGLQAAPPPAPGSASALNLIALILGPAGREVNINVVRNLTEGRGRLLQVIVQKDYDDLEGGE